MTTPTQFVATKLSDPWLLALAALFAIACIVAATLSGLMNELWEMVNPVFLFNADSATSSSNPGQAWAYQWFFIKFWLVPFGVALIAEVIVFLFLCYVGFSEE